MGPQMGWAEGGTGEGVWVGRPEVISGEGRVGWGTPGVSGEGACCDRGLGSEPCRSVAAGWGSSNGRRGLWGRPGCAGRAGAVKTGLQRLEGRVQGWIYRVRRTGVAEEKPRGQAALGGHQGPSLSVVGPRRWHMAGGTAGSALVDPGPGTRQRCVGLFSALQGHCQGNPRACWEHA